MYAQFPNALKAAGMLAVYCKAGECPEQLVAYAGDRELAYHEQQLAGLTEAQLVELVATGNVAVGNSTVGWLDSMALLASGFAYTSQQQAAQVAQWQAQHPALHAAPRPQYPAMEQRFLADLAAG